LNNNFAKLNKEKENEEKRKEEKTEKRGKERERKRETERNHLFGALGINSPHTLLREPKKEKKNTKT